MFARIERDKTGNIPAPNIAEIERLLTDYRESRESSCEDYLHLARTDSAEYWPILARAALEVDSISTWLSASPLPPQFIEFAGDARQYPVLMGETLTDVRNWIAALIDAGHSFNLDDHPSTIVSEEYGNSSPKFSPEAAAFLAAQVGAMWAVCETLNVCPHQIHLALAPVPTLPERKPATVNQGWVYYVTDIKPRPLDFQYQLLGRLQQDCEYFLNNGQRNVKHLHQNSVAEQIALMKAIWNGLEAKPEWLSGGDIEAYEEAMCAPTPK